MREVVRWPRAGESTKWTKWHYITDSMGDRNGRTQCGKYYPRYGSEFAQQYGERLTPTEMCQGCVLAEMGSHPRERDDTSFNISWDVGRREVDGIEIGFVATWTDPQTGEERVLVRDTMADADKAARMDIARKYGFDALALEPSDV